MVLFSTVMLNACTEEKAQALLNASLLFKTEANKAVDAYENLFIAMSRMTKHENRSTPEGVQSEIQKMYCEKVCGDPNICDCDDATDEAKFDQRLLHISSLRKSIQSTIERMNAPIKIANSVKVQFVDLRNTYDRFASSLNRLPDGRFLIDKGVISCVAELGARLSNNLAIMGKNLQEEQFPLTGPESTAFGKLSASLETGDAAKLALAVIEWTDAISERRRLVSDAVAQSFVAAKAGRNIVKAAEKFNDTSLNDLLILIGEAMDVAQDENILELAKSQSRLESLHKEWVKDTVWGPVLKLPVDDDNTKCNQIDKEAT